MKIQLAIALTIFSTAASAQEPSKPFVPYTITETEHRDIANILGEIPLKYSAGLNNFFVAKAAKAATPEKPKVEPEKKK